MKHIFTFVLLLASQCTVLAQWELVTPIKNTSVYTDIVMVNDQVGYLADRILGTILRTDDGGATWIRRAHNMQNKPQAFHMWDAGRGVCVGEGGMIIRTTDGFLTTTTSLNPTYGKLNCVNFLNDTLGWIGTQTGKIYRTTDAGVSWSMMASGQTTSEYITEIQFVDENIGYASAYGGGKVLKSTDGGLTWQSIAPVDLVFIRDLHFSDAMNGIAVGHVGHIIRTTDGGANWTFMPSNTTYNLYSLAVQGNKMVACGAWGRVVYSNDGGLTWTEQTVGFEHSCVSITPSGFGVMGSNGRLERTTNFGASWSVLHEGTSSESINKMSFANNIMGVAANGLRTTDGGRTWVAASSSGLGVHIRADGIGCRGGSVGSFGRTTDFFATGINGTGPSMAIRAVWSLGGNTHLVAGGAVAGGIYRTTNNGSSWTRVLDIGNITQYDLWFVDDMQGYCAGEANYRTLDGGLTWQPMAPTSPSNTIFFLDAQLGWTDSHRTNDGGDTWTYMGGTPQSCSSIFFTDPDTGYAVASSGQTEKSVDGGVTWANVLPAIFNASVFDAAYVDGYVVIGGGNGDIHRARVGCSSTPQVPVVTVAGNTLCSSINGQVQWYQNNILVPDSTAQCITVDQTGSYSVVVVDQLGCTSAASVPVNVIVTGMYPITASFGTRVYPNPATDRIWIERANSGPSVITICDAQGRIVSTLGSSSNLFTVSLAHLLPGIYAIRIATANGPETLRFIKE